PPSTRRYERSGGADMLIHPFFDRVVTEAGGQPARRLLLELSQLGSQALSSEEIAARTRLPRPRVDHAVASLVARGVLRKNEGDRTDSYALIHPALVRRIEEYAAVDAARTQDARRALRRRVLAGSRLS